MGAPHSFWYGAKSKGGTTQVHHSFFAGDDDTSGSSGDKPCFKCEQLGHWKKNCTKGSPGRGGKAAGGGVNSSNGKSAKDRPVLKHKKYHCAYHKDAPGKLCSTWSCVALKYAPVEERLKLLKANGDCELCCGDCPRNSCQAKTKRTCGGNKDGRGCGSQHLGHKLYCKNAQLCFSTQVKPYCKLMKVRMREFCYK